MTGFSFSLAVCFSRSSYLAAQEQQDFSGPLIRALKQCCVIFVGFEGFFPLCSENHHSCPARVLRRPKRFDFFAAFCSNIRALHSADGDKRHLVSCSARIVLATPSSPPGTGLSQRAGKQAGLHRLLEDADVFAAAEHTGAAPASLIFPCCNLLLWCRLSPAPLLPHLLPSGCG